MALPLPTSLACSRLRPSGILGVEIPLSSYPDMDRDLVEAVLWSLKFFILASASESSGVLYVLINS